MTEKIGICKNMTKNTIIIYDPERDEEYKIKHPYIYYKSIFRKWQKLFKGKDVSYYEDGNCIVFRLLKLGETMIFTQFQNRKSCERDRFLQGLHEEAKQRHIKANTTVRTQQCLDMVESWKDGKPDLENIKLENTYIYIK